jgi:hypothetical protein
MAPSRALMIHRCDPSRQLGKLGGSEQYIFDTHDLKVRNKRQRNRRNQRTILLKDFEPGKTVIGSGWIFERREKAAKETDNSPEIRVEDNRRHLAAGDCREDHRQAPRYAGRG